MKTYEKPSAALAALKTTDIIMTSEQLNDGVSVEITALQSFNWNE